MMQDIVLQSPETDVAQQLIVLLHGYGADAADLRPLGKTLAKAFPSACVVSLQAPDLGEHGFGRQWYSLLNVDDDVSVGEGETARAPRVAKALPDLAQRIAQWQTLSGVSHEATLLVGFSQGASMALAYAHSEHASNTPPARVVSLSGRMVSLPNTTPEATTIHWVHGKMDSVIPYDLCARAAEHLVAIGADVTADILPHTGHEITAEVLRTLVHRLQTHIPKRLWQAALQADPALQSQH